MDWQANIQLKDQYPKDLIPAADIMKKHRYYYSGTRKTEQKTSKTQNPKKKKAERRKRKRQKKNINQVSHRKVNQYKTHAIAVEILDIYFPECTEEASTPKDRWALKTVTQNLCSKSQMAESLSGNQKYNKLKTKKTIC